MTPTISSKYRIIGQLGSGGMGEVLLAEDPDLQRRVALKLMSPRLVADENERKRFRTEARIASGLAHPNICVIYEVGETEEGRPFLAMEYVEGQTLEALKQERRPRLREVMQIGVEVAQALQAAHDLRLVHRDIKPSNIMLDARGHAKVLDFGLAKRLAQEELTAVTTASGPQTQAGGLIGTVHYMSPEQALGREVDHRTDIFSLGAVLYELIAGRRPFAGRSFGEIVNNVINQRPQPLELDNPRLTPELNRIVFKCLEKEPERRYQTAAALARDLGAVKAAAEKEAAQSESESRLAAAPAGKTIEPATGSRRTAIFAGIAAILLISVSGALLWHGPSQSEGRKSKPGEPRKSIAVLPFDNFSPERDTDYLSDGLTEEITTTLSKLPGLKVVSRNSSFMFKGKREDLRQVGQALQAGTLLEGSIRKVGNRIRVSAQLINAADGYHLWTETYDRPVDDIIALQEEIANRIADRLQTEGAPIKRKPVGPEAHSLYLQAKMFWNKRTEVGLRKAVELFQQALEKDPTYADAHAALASSYLLLPQYGQFLSPAQYKPLARASAERALQLDTGCAEAHAVLGMLQKNNNDFKGADEHFLRAIASDPNNATAHHWYGLCLEAAGRRAQALEELKKALELDPMSKIIHATIPEWYYMGRDYDRAILEARKEIQTFQDFAPMRTTLIAALIKKGLFAEALQETEKAQALMPEQPLMFIQFRGFCLAHLGREAEARQIIAELDRQLQEGKPMEGAMAMIHLGMREYDKACELVERIRLREGIEPEILCEPLLDEVRHLPQFQMLLQRAGLTNAPAP